MLIIFNIEQPIGNNIGNGTLQSCIGVGINELFLVSTQSMMMLPMVSLLVYLGASHLLIFLFFRIFGFIITYPLTYIRFVIAPMIPNFTDKVIIITVDTNNTVFVTHLD